MKMNELRNMSGAKLHEELVALQRELANLRMQKGISESIKTHNFKRVRRDVARIKTLLNEQERANDSE